MIATEEIDKSTTSPPSALSEEERYCLIYSKSKVYVKPTAYSKDKIPGFVALVKREALNPTYLLAWIPEALLEEKGSTEWDKFVKIENKASLEECDDDVVLIELPVHRPECYTFSVPLTSVYSLSVQPPNLSSWCGSVGINLINGETLPTLYFHDDESCSFSLSDPSPIISNSAPTYPPPQVRVPKSANSWGGEDFLSRLRMYAHILRSNAQPSLFLVDPSRADIEVHSPPIFSDDAVDDIMAESSIRSTTSPIPIHRRPRQTNKNSSSLSANHNIFSDHSPSAPHALPQPTLKTMSAFPTRQALHSFANITRATRNVAQNIFSHPLAKPVVPHLPGPVKSLVVADGEWEWGSWVEKGGLVEFESARVYLAKWAKVVAEEGERSRRKEAQIIMSATSDNEPSCLGVFELLHTTSNLPTPKSSRDPTRPIDEDTWSQWFLDNGHPKIGIEKLKKEIFERGISSEGMLRQNIWPFLLGVLHWNVSSEERQCRWNEKMKLYHDLKKVWYEVPEMFDRPDIIEERRRIDVDCRRTDRSQPMFSDWEKRTSNHGNDDSQASTNEHVDSLAGILLTYYLYEKDLGYVQGMSDICSPIYVTMNGDEPMTFWCFVEVMDRMKQNFLRDQSGMKKQLMLLQELVALMDAELYNHFEKTSSLNMFFCFRWVLVAFKREFSFEDILRLWEVLWTDHYSTNFVLFVALAIIESNRDVILRYLVEFDEIFKYFNDLSMTIELDATLGQAEILFLSFSQLFDDIHRREAKGLPSASADKLSQRDITRPISLSSVSKISDNLAVLLCNTRSSSS